MFDVFVPHAEVDFCDGTTTKMFLVLTLRDEGKGKKRKEGRKKRGEGKKPLFFFPLTSNLPWLCCSVVSHVMYLGFVVSGLCFVY